MKEKEMRRFCSMRSITTLATLTALLLASGAGNKWR
jgi:hypothetical protein